MEFGVWKTKQQHNFVLDLHLTNRLGLRFKKIKGVSSYSIGPPYVDIPEITSSWCTENTIGASSHTCCMGYAPGCLPSATKWFFYHMQ